MRTRISARGGLARTLALSLILLLSGCFWESDSGGGGVPAASSFTIIEDEPNDEVTESATILPGQPVRGDLIDAGDIDWYVIRLNVGATVRVEVWATRLDQARWDASGTAPLLTVFFPTSEDKLLEQGTSAGWGFGTQDFEVPVFQMPSTGPFFWIKLEPDIPGLPGGRYVLRLSYVSFGPGPTEDEHPNDVGSNDSTGTAEPVFPGTLNGFHRNGNDDFFSVTVPGPSVLRFEVVGHRVGSFEGELTAFDPLLRLFDRDGTTLLAQTDDVFLADPAIQYEVSAAGTYAVEVSQSPTSENDGKYRLITSTSLAAGLAEVEPNDLTVTANAFGYGQNVSGTIGPGEDDWFRFTGAAGDMVRLQVFDSQNSASASETILVTPIASDGITPIPFDRGPFFQVQTSILQADGTNFLHVQPGAGALGPTRYRLELRRFHATAYETEPNDTIAQAPLYPGGGFASGAIQAPGDADVFRFTASSHQLVVFDVFAGSAATGSNQYPEYSGHGSALAPLLRIRDENGNVIASSTSLPANGVYTESVADGLPTAAVAIVGSPATTTYYVEVTSADGTGGPAHTYALQRR